MRLADLAWHDVDTTTIRNCWKKAGILPDMLPSSSPTNQPSIPISSLLDDTGTNESCVVAAEQEVEAALDNLITTGALQMTNRMDLEALLNPEGESEVMTETSDLEIFKAVMEAVEARENIEAQGGDDADCRPPEPRPTHLQALKAASTLCHYIEELNDPIARKMEAILSSFNRKIRLERNKTLTETVLTDFFRKA